MGFTHRVLAFSVLLEIRVLLKISMDLIQKRL